MATQVAVKRIGCAKSKLYAHDSYPLDGAMTAWTSTKLHHYVARVIYMAKVIWTINEYSGWPL